ncbi:ABC transporter ATP-binding protein [Ideonella azotifigens]|uniref:ABC transporter ATP-binding protein n=2 Tax=Ideonella azotifigens TaxID=513160 RepID=UPI001E3ED755|nr:ABC transporter ATP-binding protein [Ideonella azotifigens]MCD2338906.1 ABC transporter ATP-binding protein [Ideonella azotifigens]
MNSPALIELKAVDRRYETGLLALQGVDLRIAPGEFVSLLGPSGCGKSSVLRLLAGLDLPSSGEVLRQGAAATRGPVRDAGFVFQEPTLMPWANVVTNVELPLRLQGMAAEPRAAAALAALQRVGLGEFAEAMPRELSGGMKMRAAIARALVTQPALLLLDEPFAALDEITRFALNESLLSLWLPQGEKTKVPAFTGVFVTHSVFEAVFLSQRVLVMSARPGRIIEDLRIEGPRLRDASFRQSPVFVDACARLSTALARAAEEPALG